MQSEAGPVLLSSSWLMALLWRCMSCVWSYAVGFDLTVLYHIRRTLGRVVRDLAMAYRRLYASP
jgi:hypothetical protein